MELGGQGEEGGRGGKVKWAWGGGGGRRRHQETGDGERGRGGREPRRRGSFTFDHSHINHLKMKTTNYWVEKCANQT